MKNLSQTARIMAASISAFLSLGVLTAQAAVYNWINSSGGDWSTASNWSPNGVPGSADTANITVSGNYSVTLDISPTVAGLVLGSSTAGSTQTLLIGAQTITVNGPIQISPQGQFNLSNGALAGTNVVTGLLTWSGGNMSGNMTIASNSVLSIVTGGGNGMKGLVLTNYGTVIWTNAAIYCYSPGSLLINYGLWNAQSDNSMYGGYGGGTTDFANFGTFLKSSSTNATVLDVNVLFSNSGTIDVEAGQLDIQGGGSSTGGQITTTNSGVVNFSSVTFAFSNNFTGAGAYVAGGAIFDGTITGTLNWDGGDLAGDLTVASNGVLNIASGGGNGFDGLVLTNYGAVNWGNASIYSYGPNNAHIYNYGLWNAQSDNNLYGGYGGGSTQFENIGTFVKSGTTNTTTIDLGVVFNNVGVVDVQSGALDIGGGTSSGGNFTTASGATLNFITTPYNFTNNNSITGAGSYLTAGAVFGGAITGTLSWNGGNLSGDLTLTSNGVLNILAGGGNGLRNFVLTNYGAVNWSNTAIYSYGPDNAQIYNYGTWTAQSDNECYGGYGGGSTLFDNFGSFLKTGNAGVSVLDGGVVFNNTGTVDAESGTLEIEGGGTNSGSGTFATSNGGLLGLDNVTFANSASIKSGTIVDLGGNTTIDGVLTATNLELVSGTLGGTNVLVGTLTWSGGSITGNMTIASNGVLNIVAGGGNGFKDLVLTNYGTINWSNTQIYSYGPSNNALIYNYGVWNAQSDNDLYGGYGGGSTVIENYGTFLKSGGTNATLFDGETVFNNTGIVDSESGAVDINGGGQSSGGQIMTTNEGTINFSSYTFTNDNEFVGSGGYVSGGATFGGTIEGTLNWDGGSMSGGLTLASNSVLNIVNGGGNGLRSLLLTNYGIVNWSNTQLYSYGPGNAQIYNYGLWIAQSDNALYGGYGGGSTLFENIGTFLKSGTTNTTTLDSGVVFNNIGAVNVESGTLNIGGGTSSGGFTTVGGSAIDFYNTAYTFTNSNTFTGPGSAVSGGATFAGSISGTLTWDGGSVAGALTLSSNGILNIVNGGGNGLRGIVLTNYGTVNWTNTQIYSYGPGNAQIYNYGLWNAQSDNALYGGYGGGSTLFDNFGTFVKSGNTGVTELDGGVVFNSTGTITVESGTLDLAGGGTNTGSFVTTNGGVIILDNATFPNGASFNGGATVQLGGNTTVNGLLTAGNLEFSSGTLSGTNVLEGTLTWSGGSLAGNLTVTTNSVLNIVQGGGYGFDALVLTNYGTVNWTNATIYALSKNTTAIYNYGLWDAQSDETFFGGYGGGITLFDNFGIFRKSGNTGVTELDASVEFNNLGTVQAQSGTISLGENTSLAGGTLNFSINNQTNYGTVSLTGAAVLSGSLSVNFNNGFLPASGSKFGLISGSDLSGSLSTGALPFGMSFAYSATNVSLVWNGITQADWAAGSSVLYGTTTITFLESPGIIVQVVASANGISHLLGATTSGGLGTVTFNANQLPNGLFNLQAILLNSAGQVVGDFSRPAFVNNSLVWHDGTLSTNETWGTNNVNAVDQNVIVPNGVTLTVAPGAIIKFAAGTGIIVEAGGVLDASGATTNAPIIFTSIKDDTVGGDSNEDGGNSVPQAGDWNGIIANGNFLTSPYTQVRFVLLTHSGLLSQSQEWAGAQEHFITGNVIVPKNVTLTIGPGAIVKFGLGRNITVQSGGTLIANGTVAQPIYFTSVNDNSVGTSASTISPPPAAGDWDSIYLSGGNATFDHVYLSYGGGPDSLNSGLISVNGAGSVVSVSDSVLSQALYRGIQAEYGTVNVTNCVVTGADRGIQSGLSGPTTVNVINCTLDGNNYGVFAHGGVLNIANTIIADSLTAGLAYCCGSVLTTFENNDVWSATGSYASSIWPVPNQTGTHGNISENPNFVNAAQGNFQLNDGSPCIDAADGSVASLTDLTGAPRYNDSAVLVKTGTPNANGAFPDMGAYEFVKTASSAIDLIATAVSGPATATAGQTVTVEWNDVSIGTGAATGPWHDTISLIPQNGGDPLLVATVLEAQHVVLGPGQTYAASASVVVPGGQPGSYQWQVQVNSAGDVFEGINSTNNIDLEPTPTFLTDPPLAIGDTVTNMFTGAGQSNVYAVVSPGQTFALTAQSGIAGSALELFVGDGYVPTPSEFDFASSQFDSQTASVTVPNNNNDTYYVVVYAVSVTGGSVTYTLTASTSGFALNSVSPSTMVNSGPVTLQISGNQLTVNQNYTLTGPGGAFSATSVQSPDPTVAYATFNLGGAPGGSYSVLVGQPGGQALALSNAVLVTVSPSNAPAPSASFSVQLEVPPVFRANRPLSGSISYSDSGTIDMPAPILILTSGGAAALAPQGSTNYANTDLVLVAASFEGPAGTLTAGQSWSIGFSALSPNDASIPFEVDYELATSTNIIDYVGLQTKLRPAGYTDANWNEIWTNFQAQAGPTWGGFVKLVDSYASEMALDNPSSAFYSVPEVLGFAFADLLDKANANVLGTVYLNDANHPAAGISILFAGANGTNAPVAGSVSAADGTFFAGGLPPGTYSLSAPGYVLEGPASITIPASDYVADVAVIITEGGTISGTLSNATYGTSPSPASPAYAAQFAGQVLSGISVEAIGTNGDSFSTTSDINGHYSLSALPPDNYVIAELGGSFGGSTTGTGVQFAVQYATNLVVAGGSSVVQNFVVPINNAVMAGEVYAAGTTTPLTNASVFFNVAPGVVESTNTDANGLFAFSVYGPSFTASISAPGYVTFTGALTTSPSASNPQAIYLSPAGTFDVSLTTDSGEAITNAVITVTSSNGVVVGEGVTDANGQLVISNLAAGTYSVQEIAYGYQTINKTVSIGAGTSSTNASTMAVMGGIIGQVINGSSAPISGIPVNIYGDQATNDNIEVTVNTDINGNYSVLGLPPGSYGISVGNEAGLNQQLTRIASNELVTVNFTLPSSLVQGTVLASDGVTPVPQATVALSQSGQILAVATTDTNGAYLLRVLIPGNYDLAASAPTGMSSNQPIVVSANGSVAVPPLVFGSDSLNFLVTDTNGVPLTNATISVFPGVSGPAVPQVFSATTGYMGAAAIFGLVNGQYTIFVHQSGFARFWQTVNLSGTTSLTYALSPGVTMSGTIVNSANQPVSQGMVSVYDPAAAILVAVATSDSTGSYNVPDLYLGTFDVLFSQPNYQSTELTNVVVNSNPFTEAGVLANQTTSLSGAVTDSAGNPLPLGLVVITNSTGATFAILQTTNNGTWSLNQLPPGQYAVAIVAPGYLPPMPISVNLAAGSPVTISNALPAVATDDDGDDDSSIGYTVTGLGSFFKNATGSSVTPYHIDVGNIPAAGPCPQAQQLQQECLKAKMIVDNAEIAWFQGYQGTSEALGATGATTLTHGLVTAVDALAAHPSSQAFQGWQGLSEMSGGAQAAIKGADYSATIAHIVTSFNDIKSSLAGTDFHDFTSISMFLSGAVADLAANGLDARTIAELKVGLTSNPGNPIAVVADLVNLLNDFWTGYGDYQSSVAIDTANMLNYQAAAAKYSKLVGQLNYVNGDCPPTVPPPVPPDNPTPGPKQTVNNVQSADPNNKFATGIGQPGWVPEGAAITYTIEFANETNASAPAQQVTITDPLSADLDWSTLQLTTIAFNNVVIAIQPGVQTFSTNANVSTDTNPVAVNASLNPATGELSWLMESINPATGQLITDPLAGFLPPDNAQGQGEGYVIYTIKPRSGLATGAQITNQATIVFDVNAPIITPTTTNFVGNGAPVITSQPQQVTTNLGATAVFSVTASSSAPYFYQWSKNGVILPGATNSVLELQNVQLTNVGSYSVTLSTGVATTTSAEAALTVTTNPSITQIEVVTTGKGSVSPVENGKKLQIGHTYTITAVPGLNYLFANWSGFVFTNTATLKFVMQSNMLLQANFVTNIFVAAHGSYAGLFTPEDAPREQTNSGAFTISVTKTGALSGQLLLGGQTVSLIGQFDVTGAAEIVSRRHGQTSITTLLQLDPANQTVEGTVSDGSFVATLQGYQSVFAATRPATQFEGPYTLIIPGTNNPAVGPFGDSYGTLSVSSQGAIVLAGSLADGTPINQSTTISGEGYWPLYISLYGGKGSLWGWNLFTNHTIVNVGSLSWINETNTSKTALYRSGFTNDDATLIGALYTPTVNWINDLTAVWMGGNLPFEVACSVSNAQNGTISVTNVVPSTSKPTLKILKTTGVISGTFLNPSNLKQTISFKGVLLHSQTNASGYFLGTNQSGAFMLGPP